ncbi:AAA family ATPase [Bradyrhizobium sp. BRP22]|uniref:trifunctional serine/threonine-protein kinase/ATP-binding protein/sensor histidine kinase n=1 Tax=Bradyrhizobium sp. BRP22 TaxID=2793821 RepID=UPI001CD73CB3|nr:AAA family ATPase [Bradyrhizobium sp. BRP22]MCA1458264.1 AAA family ATPase [Bradyrhizobium sp. BRP22]
MHVSSRIPTNGDAGLKASWDDGERLFCRERRRGADGNVKSVLIVMAAAEHPPAAILDRLAHEYALRDELDGTCAVRPLELIRDGGRTLLILEDPGGEPLEDQLLGVPMKLDRFLGLALAITTAVDQLHRRGLIHKDLKPANILVTGTDEVRITGFGLTSRLPRERQRLEPPETIAGTLAYMAPEQTGRMNRSIDSRSDLYALGVTFYRMLTGALPFTAANPMEWVHSHVARRAVPPAERINGVPSVVSAIVMKLLAKTAEDRYQTAVGLKNDLERSVAEWEAQGRIDDFVLGRTDTPDRLLIPERLYGREHEIEALLASYDRVARSGTPELILVSGPSGIGKSALVDEMHKALIPLGGFFASGKFDQHRRDMPYATLAHALQGLIRGLLAKNDAELAPWRRALRDALGHLGQLMVDLAPELRLLIGDQPPVPETSPQDAQRRFQLVVRRFVAIFAKPHHPLVLFLDDLQWLDVATLELIEYLLNRSDLRNLLLVAAYRPNDVDVKHLLAQWLSEIRASRKRVREVDLAPLTRDAVGEFAADALRCEPAYAMPIAELAYEKTGGNPFFLTQFLQALAEEKLLTFDHDKRQWRWDLERIEDKSYAENVADLMVGKLSGLRDETRRALLELACLGSSAEVAMLSLVHGGSEQTLHVDMRDATRLELVRRLNNSYVFVHDRVQEAAYALEPDQHRRTALHLRIGMALAAQPTPDETNERVYIVANQLNRGIAALARDAERNQVIAVNLEAGRRARSATAYHAATTYLETARNLLGEEGHPRCSRDAFAIGLLHAECKFLLGDLDTAKAELTILSQSRSDIQASAEVARLQAQLYTAAGQLKPAVDVCLAFLHKTGIDWAPHPDRTEVDDNRRRLRGLAERLSDTQLHTLPPMTDPKHRATMCVLADLLTPAFLTDRNLSDIMLVEATRLTIEHGISPEACYPLTAIFGVLASNSTDAELGFRLSQFGATLADRHPQLGLSGRALLVFGLHVTPWIRPIRSGRPFIQRALATCLTTGELAFAAYSHRGLISVDLFCGDSLAEVCSSAQQALSFAEGLGVRLAAEGLVRQRELARSLAGRDDNNRFESPASLQPPDASEPLSAFFHYATQIQIEVLAGRDDVAIDLATHAERLSWCARSYSDFTEYRFYTALAHAGAYHSSDSEDREHHLGDLREHHRKLTVWSNRCPANFAARQKLVTAELARIEGRELEAEQLYEESIGLAQESGFVQIEAIAAERAARFYEARGIRTVVLSYLMKARDCYARWGAAAKVRQLEEFHPGLRERGSAFNAAGTIGAPVEQLDLATVLKVSEAVSGEIVLERLTETLLRSAIEHAGAERGVLILPRGPELRIRAEAVTGGGSVALDLADSPISAAEVPMSIVRYTARTRESVVLDDASRSNAFGDDEYIKQKRVRSALCVPLIKQGGTVAFLYLENNLASRVFTPARIAILKFLASEAATSLDNARLYRELQERESKIRRLVESNIIGIFIFDHIPDILDANEAFLKTLGYDRDDLAAGRLRWADLTPPEWQERTDRARDELKATRVVKPFEKAFFHKDGSRVPVLTGGALFDNEQEQGVAFVLDLSERKRAETEARENEQRYREAQMELAHANRVAVMGQLTASIAHEVNQPNTAVIASAQAALSWLDHQPPALEQTRRALTRAIENGIRSSEVIGRIRDLIKKSPPKRDSLAINNVIGHVIELTQTEAARNGVSIKTAFADRLPKVIGDRVELQQVTLNLILNAIEALSGTMEGKRELLIQTARADADSILVSIADSGPGLSAEGLARLFEPFYTTKSGGLGIGLSICRSIIVAHGGRLWVTTNEPRGAVFQFTVPIDDGSAVG